MRTIRLCLVVLILGGGLGLGWRWYGDQKLPQHQGRSLRLWFEELCRVASASEGLEDGTRELECKLAILGMGTHAVPFLVEQAMSGREDGPMRRGLRRALSELPGGRWNRWIVPWAEIQAQAAGLVGPLRPPADLVLPQVLPFVRGPDERLRIQGLLLLGCLRDGAEEAVPLLVEALGEKGDPWVRAAASAALGQLKSRATGAVDQVVDLMDPATVDLHVLRWLAGLGSAASNAVPRLEEIVASEYHESRFEALVALLSIRPDHESGLALIRQTVSDEGSPITRAQAAREELAAAWISSPRRPHPEVGSLLEPLARVEIRAWSPNNAMTRATRALERLAPERVVLLYRQALEGAGWVHAATGLLRLDRNDAEATRRLVEGMAGDSPEGMSAILGLREAGSSNTEAIRALQSVVQSRPPPEEHMGQLRVLNAAYALARIRYREWMESVGFDELDW